MSQIFQKIYHISGSFVRVLSLVFTAFLFLSAFLSTCYAENMTTQKVLTRWDNPFINFLGTALFLLVLMFVSDLICRKSGRRLRVLLFLVLLWCVFCGIVLVLFSKTVPAADAMSVYAAAESLANGDTSVIHPLDSYLSYYPQQIGLVAFYEPLIRLWNLVPIDYPAYHFIKCIYIVLVCVIIFCQYRTVHLLWQDERTDGTYLLLAGTNLPLILYSSFVYGEIPSFAAFSAGCLLLFKLLREDAGRKQQLLYAAGSLVLFTLSVLLRKNSLILMIAVLIVVLLESLSSGRKKLLLFALLCALGSFTILPATQACYEHRADNKLSSGVTALSYFAMGMQESSRGNGWYNGFNFETYQASGMDAAITNDISRAFIEERLTYFGEHPGYAASFYLYKYLSQWADGTYASRQATLATFGGRVEFFQQIYEGTYSKYFIGYCNLYQNVLYLGVVLFCLFSFSRGRKSSKDAGTAPRLYVYLGLIGVFGGFLFHMIWEANGRYIFLYGLLLLPYTARGISEWKLPENLPKNKFPMKVFLCFLLLCAAVGLLVLFLFDRRTHHFHADEVRKADISALSDGRYDGLLLSMYTPEAFDAEDFNYYRAISTTQAFHTFENLADIGDYLEQGFSRNANLATVYIGIDPYVISGLYGHHASLYIRDYANYLTDYVQFYPDAHFELLLPSYSLDHLRSMSDREYEDLVTAYRNLVNLYTPYDNVVIYFVGYEEWLIANPGNYDDGNFCTPDIAHTILTYTFRDDRYALNPDNMEERFAQMTTLVQAPPIVYPNYSDYSIVFFGDSVIGNYQNSLSIPGVVAGLSGAHTYNLGLGGSSACGSPSPGDHSLNTIVDAFLAGDVSSFEESATPYTGIRTYQEEHTQNLCFLINYGLNDYFNGTPISSDNPLDPYTYAGSIRLAVSKLRETYPDSRIILATPNFTNYYGAGTEIKSDVGGQMTDYVDAVLTLAEELDVDYMNNYEEFGVNSENHNLYLEDGCHPNVSLRYIYGQHIIEKLSDMLSK